MGSKVGFIYGIICPFYPNLLTPANSFLVLAGGMSFLSLIFGWFFLPELKNRSLEEIEVMFESDTPMRKFGKYETDADGIGAGVTRIERMDETDLTAAKVHALVTQRGSFGEDAEAGNK